MKSLLVLAILVLTLSCNQRSPEEYTNRPQGNTGKFISTETKKNQKRGTFQPYIKIYNSEMEMNKHFSASTALCEDLEKCSSSVSAFYQKEGKSLRRCTSFLVDKNIAVVNEHCLSSVNLIPQNIIFKFPKTKQSPEAVATFKRVLRTGQVLRDRLPKNIPIEKLPDFAFLELNENLNRAPLVFSMTPREQDQIVQLQKMDFSEDDYSSLLIAQECKVTLQTGSPFTGSGVSPLIRLKDCPVQKGNSGAPVLNAEGFVLGVVMSSYAGKEGRAFAEAVSAACLEEGGQKCSYIEDKKTDWKKEKLTELITKIKAEFEEYKAKNSQRFHWKAVEEEESSHVYALTAQPSCRLREGMDGGRNTVESRQWIVFLSTNEDFEEELEYNSKKINVVVGNLPVCRSKTF